MPFSVITTGNFYSVVFKPTTDAAWISFTPRPGFTTGNLADAIIDGTPIVIHVLDDASGYFAYSGGQGFGYDDSHILAASITPLTKHSLVSSEGQTTLWAKSGSGVVYLLDFASQLIQTYSPAVAGPFKTFLP